MHELDVDMGVAFPPVVCHTGRIMSFHRVLNGLITAETVDLIMSSAFPAGFLSL